MTKKNESMLDLIREAYDMLKDRSEQEASLIYHVAKLDNEERSAIILAYQNIQQEKEEIVMKNEWLEKEMLDLRVDRRRKKQSRVVTLGLIMLAFLNMMMSYETLYARPPSRDMRSATWICSCGYENYDKISYCGVCGREKPRKRR